MVFKIITAPTFEVLERKVNDFLKSNITINGNRYSILKFKILFLPEHEVAAHCYQIHFTYK